MAACLSVRGVASHRCAAALWRIDGFERNAIDITVDRPVRLRRGGFVLHQSTQFDRFDVVEIQNIPCTPVDRTVLDVAALMTVRDVELIVDAVIRQKLVTLAELVRVLDRHSRKGRDGCGRLRSVLEERTDGEAVPDSRWNRRVARLLIDSGLPTPSLEHVVAPDGRFISRVDICYPAARLAIELDSLRYHMNRKAFERDRQQRNQLVNAGWEVLNFTWADFTRRPTQLVRTVATALRRRSGGDSPR